MSIYDKVHIQIKDTLQKLYYKIHDRRHNHFIEKFLFIILCKIDIRLAPHINNSNQFPAFYFLSEYYCNIACNMLKGLQVSLNGVKYKFADVHLVYYQIEFIIKYLKKFPQLQFSYDYKNDCLYDLNTGEVIENIFDYLKSRKNVINNEKC